MKNIMEHVRTKKDFKAVFIDELHFDQNHLGYTFTQDDQKLIDNLECFWVAPRDKGQIKLLGEQIHDFGLNNFRKFQLVSNMRNSNSVHQYTKSHCGKNKIMQLLPNTLWNFPDGKKVHEIADPINCIKKAIKSAKKGVLVIVGMYEDNYFLSKLNKDIGLKKIGVLESSSLENYAIFKQPSDTIIHFGGASKIPGENCIQHLNKKGNILFVSPERVAGFEWPTVVCLGTIWDMTVPDTEHFVNTYLRTTADLYICKGPTKPVAIEIYFLILAIIMTVYRWLQFFFQ